MAKQNEKIIKKPLLIVGYERSGTTLLRRLVSMHPDLEYELIHERVNKLYKCKTTKQAINVLSYAGTQAGEKTGSIMSIRSGQKVPYTTAKGARKTVKKFRSLFPKSWIIHITRNPIYAINSQVRTFNRDPKACIRNYFKAVPAIVKWLRAVNGVKFVQFEDIISTPQAFVDDLYAWIGGETPLSHIKNVISTRPPWRYQNRIMPGLRYFDEIAKKTPKMVLSNDIIKIIKNAHNI
jgi:hypothetical protein